MFRSKIFCLSSCSNTFASFFRKKIHYAHEISKMTKPFKKESTNFILKFSAEIVIVD